MSKNSLELKDFVNDPTFIENMNRAFSDLRADYELSMDSTCEKINELKSLHVDVKIQALIRIGNMHSFVNMEMSY